MGYGTHTSHTYVEKRYLEEAQFVLCLCHAMLLETKKPDDLIGTNSHSHDEGITLIENIPEINKINSQISLFNSTNLHFLGICN